MSDDLRELQSLWEMSKTPMRVNAIRELGADEAYCKRCGHTCLVCINEPDMALIGVLALIDKAAQISNGDVTAYLQEARRLIRGENR